MKKQSLSQKKFFITNNFNNFFGMPRPSFGMIMKNEGKEKFLEYFSRNLNLEVIQGKIDPIIGREKEIDGLITILMRKNKNNPVLVYLQG